MMTPLDFFDDALFAAMAAIGFASISHAPRRSFAICALAAAVAHSLRLLLLVSPSVLHNIIVASTVAAFAAGLIAVALAPMVKVPAEACLFPSLLPMIPGMYAYRAVRALVGCLSVGAPDFNAQASLLLFNGLMCVAIVVGMVLGANIPIFIFKRISFQVTR